MTNNRLNLINDLTTAIEDSVYCGLLDSDVEPGEAWNLTFSRGFSIAEDVEDEVSV